MLKQFSSSMWMNFILYIQYLCTLQWEISVLVFVFVFVFFCFCFFIPKTLFILNLIVANLKSAKIFLKLSENVKLQQSLDPNHGKLTQ